MMKRLFFALALFFCATPAMAQESAESFAARLQDIVGKPLTGTIILASAKAEGNLLIVVLDAPSWEGTDRARIPGLFLTGFCGGGDEFNYFKVNRLRVDTLDNGQDLKVGTVVDKCPAKNPAQ